MVLAKDILGKRGEEEAVKLLKKKGYKIIKTNFKARYGEIDIIAIEPKSEKKQDSTLVFAEVKTRSSKSYGSPLEAITYWKVKSLIRTAQFYKLTHPHSPSLLRIDAISVIFAPGGEVSEIEHIQNAAENQA